MSWTEMTRSPVMPGDSVILVGNGPSMVLSGERGAQIDSFDQVVRFNWFSIRGFEAHVGTRTTLWCSFGRGSLPRDEEQRPVNAIYLEPPAGKTKAFAFAIDRAWCIPRAFYDAAAARVRARSAIADRLPKQLAPSSGLVVALWLLETHYVPHVVLVGFDHFAKGRSGGHHYWARRPDGTVKAYKPPPEHDGAAEAAMFSELREAGRISYL